MSQLLLETHLFSENIELNLFSYFKLFSSYGCTYLYYTIKSQDNIRLRFTTDENWIQLYLHENLVMFDPVKVACENNSNNRIIAWNTLPAMDLKQKRTMEARTSYGIYNGFSIVKSDENSNCQRVLALATNSPSVSLMQDLISYKDNFFSDVEKIFLLV